ncbi:uncharacterized protein FIBRA_08674 [Fibroporia radiculosa]|uniref:Uncharacterized protein n=1 Tax=Fibroporia radiculosa TaxID=599839 RepID=J4GI13_9APHY|nr:uncharacterized protein FIBRA_08674 [Fibroporia radiculosa]CCM06413.1 predicted protein [Fibroporia radiculosa]
MAGVDQQPNPYAQGYTSGTPAVPSLREMSAEEVAFQTILSEFKKAWRGTGVSVMKMVEISSPVNAIYKYDGYR